MTAPGRGRKALSVAVACALLTGAGVTTVGYLAGQDAQQQRIEREQAQQQALAAAQAAAADEAQRRRELAAAVVAQQQAVAAQREQATQERDAAVAAADEALAAGAGKAPEEALGRLAHLRAEAARDTTMTWLLRTRAFNLAQATEQVHSGIAAWEAEQARIEQERLAAEQAQRERDARKSAPSAGAPAAPAAAGDIAATAEATLRSLPNSDGINLTWDHPDLGNHLGAVWIGETTIMMNSRRLAGNPGKTADVIRHEIAHVYQGRAWHNSGLSYDDFTAHLKGIFGGNGIEPSADCVALRFGASWVHYTRDCGGQAKQAAVSALIEGRLP